MPLRISTPKQVRTEITVLQFHNRSSLLEFPVKCSGCGGPIVGILYHCMACASVYFCAECYSKGADSLPKQYYFKHSAKYVSHLPLYLNSQIHTCHTESMATGTINHSQPADVQLMVAQTTTYQSYIDV